MSKRDNNISHINSYIFNHGINGKLIKCLRSLKLIIENHPQQYSDDWLAFERSRGNNESSSSSEDEDELRMRERYQNEAEANRYTQYNSDISSQRGVISFVEGSDIQNWQALKETIKQDKFEKDCNQILQELELPDLDLNKVYDIYLQAFQKGIQLNEIKLSGGGKIKKGLMLLSLKYSFNNYNDQQKIINVLPLAQHIFKKAFPHLVEIEPVIGLGIFGLTNEQHELYNDILRRYKLSEEPINIYIIAAAIYYVKNNNGKTNSYNEVMKQLGIDIKYIKIVSGMVNWIKSIYLNLT